MKAQLSPVHRAVEAAIENGGVLTLTEIRQLREKSERILTFSKGSVWAGIAVLNLVLWVELPFPTVVSIALGALALLYTFSVPIILIREHQPYLPLLERVSPGPKKRRVNEAGQRYMEQVKEQGRSFIVAEVDVLESGDDHGSDEG